MIGPRAAAEILGVHENTVRNWANAGKIPIAARLPTGYLRFRLEDIEALAKSMKPVN